MSYNQPVVIHYLINNTIYNSDINRVVLYDLFINGNPLTIRYRKWVYEYYEDQFPNDPSSGMILPETVHSLTISIDDPEFLEFFNGNYFQDSLVGKSYLIKNPNNPNRHNNVAVVNQECYDSDRNFLGVVGIIESTGEIARTRTNNIIVLDGPRTFSDFINDCLVDLT
tara:strand:+ start:4500 stop:5003 length:504 start_codon:yes stop_codon:yes gene_type:complete